MYKKFSHETHRLAILIDLVLNESVHHWTIAPNSCFMLDIGKVSNNNLRHGGFDGHSVEELALIWSCEEDVKFLSVRI